MKRIPINGEGLTLEAVEALALGKAEATIPASTIARVRKSRHLVEERIARGESIYGVNTGFGMLSSVRIPEDKLKQLQLNLLRSHCTGVGEPFSTAEVRAMTALRLNTLAKGNSGVRPVMLRTLARMLNRGVHPVVPQQGSVGASGDLAPLAHLSAVLIGEGRAEYRGRIVSGRKALRMAGIEPLRLAAKEGLSLINGTQVMSAVGLLALLRAERLCRIADIAGAMTLDALEGTGAPFDPDIYNVRAHAGQRTVSQNFLRLIRASDIAKAHRECPRIQDAYSLRCIPQVHGAVRDALVFARHTLEVEINSATDNPLVFPESGKIVSAGNFHGQPVAFAMDFVAVAVSGLAAISERRIEKLIRPSEVDVPQVRRRSFGIEEKLAGFNSGLMMVQVSAAALVSENKALAHPASVDSIPTSADKEDHVSMGSIAARKARDIVQNVENVLAMELFCAAQGLEFLKPLSPGRGAKAARDLIRKSVPPVKGDRDFSKDIAKIKALIDDGSLLAAVERAVKSLR